MAAITRDELRGAVTKNGSKRLLSIEEAATYLGMSHRTIYNMVNPKTKKPFPVRPKRLGKLIRFDIIDLDNFIDSL